MDREQVKKITVYTIISLFVLTILIYTGFEIRRYATGPELIITRPESGFVSNVSSIEIAGTAVNITEVKVNDNKIFMDEEGHFNQEILLSLGYNVLKVSGVDRFNRETEKILEIMYKP